MDELAELRARAAHLNVACRESMDVNRRILALDPGDISAANRLRRGLQDTGQTHEALAVFRKSLQANPDNAIARRRVEAIERSLRHPGVQRVPLVHNADRGRAQLVRRRARKAWTCQGRGTPPIHAEDCPYDIAPGDDYVDIQWGRVSFFDNHRVSMACAMAFWVE